MPLLSLQTETSGLEIPAGATIYFVVCGDDETEMRSDGLLYGVFAGKEAPLCYDDIRVVAREVSRLIRERISVRVSRGEIMQASLYIFIHKQKIGYRFEDESIEDPVCQALIDAYRELERDLSGARPAVEA